MIDPEDEIVVTYVVEYLTSITLYNIKTKSTREIELKEKYRKRGISLVKVENSLFVMGGTSSGKYWNLAYQLPLSSSPSLLMPKASLHRERSCASSIFCKLNKQIYIVGGFDGNFLSSCEKYNIEHDKWTLLPSLNKSKYFSSLVLFSDRTLYSVGGSSSGGFSKEIEFFDILEEEEGWKEISVTFPTLYDAGFLGTLLVQVNPKSILIMGGIIENDTIKQAVSFTPVPRARIAETTLVLSGATLSPCINCRRIVKGKYYFIPTVGSNAICFDIKAHQYSEMSQFPQVVSISLTFHSSFF